MRDRLGAGNRNHVEGVVQICRGRKQRYTVNACLMQQTILLVMRSQGYNSQESVDNVHVSLGTPATKSDSKVIDRWPMTKPEPVIPT